MGFLEIIITIVIGFVIGVIAKFITPGRDATGFILTTIVGIGGAFLAAWAGNAFGWYEPGEVPSFLAAIAGAVIILLLLRIVRRPR
jgi:uncharacterized membrane protein YeaQ/YmgE (transglycosylase-associated protein family)